MDASELAAKMLLWEKNKLELDALGKEIENEVLRLEKTQVVGGVRVTYSGGRATYDYQTPGASAPADIISKHSTARDVIDWDAVADEVPDIVVKHTTTTFDIDYKLVCKDANIEPIVVSKTEPSATIKLEK